MDTGTDGTTETVGPGSSWGRGRRVVVVVVAVVGFVAVWFEPQKLFIDERVDQAEPTARSSATSVPPGEPVGGPVTSAPVEPVDLASGEFVSLDHATRATARVLGLGDGRRFVRLEGFETDNGPDLYVYLSTNPAGGPESGFDHGFVDLGPLQGNIGDQNYEIPAEVDPTGYASVVVWCDRFDSAFGAADLSRPQA